jgi:hypothetical protein
VDVESETKNLHAKGQEGFKRNHHICNHILTLTTIIVEAKTKKHKAYSSFVDFYKPFIMVPRHLQVVVLELKVPRLTNLMISFTVILYEMLIG